MPESGNLRLTLRSRYLTKDANGRNVWQTGVERRTVPAAREKNYRDALTHLRAAALLGAQTVRIDTGGTLTPITDEQLETLAKAVDHPAYGILLHVGHWEDGDEEGGDRRMAKYAAHTHLDARITRTCLQERVQILAEAGYQGYWGVEHHSGQNEYVEVAWQLAEVLRALVHAGVK